MDGGRQAGPDDGAGGREDGMDGMDGTVGTASAAGAAGTSFAVIGAGGIGGWLGTRLAEAGHRVGFLVHGATLEALRRRGLTLIGPEGLVSARIEAPVAAADPAELLEALGSQPQAVLLTTKVGAITGLAPALRALTGPRTAVVTTQNGLEAPRLVARAVGRERCPVSPGSTPGWWSAAASRPWAARAPCTWGSGAAGRASGCTLSWRPCARPG